MTHQFGYNPPSSEFGYCDRCGHLDELRADGPSWEPFPAMYCAECRQRRFLRRLHGKRQASLLIWLVIFALVLVGAVLWMLALMR